MNLPSEKKLLLFVGRLVQAKGLDYVLNAMNLLPKDVALILIGEGERKESIKKQISDHNLGDRVMLLGSKFNVDDYYRACDVFIMSSTYEPLGQTILEAAACGLPIVAFHKNTEILTATHELELDYAIHFAKGLTGDSLSEAISSALESVRTCEIREVGHHFREVYCWERLLDALWR